MAIHLQGSAESRNLLRLPGLRKHRTMLNVDDTQRNAGKYTECQSRHALVHEYKRKRQKMNYRSLIPELSKVIDGHVYFWTFRFLLYYF